MSLLDYIEDLRVVETPFKPGQFVRFRKEYLEQNKGIPDVETMIFKILGIHHNGTVGIEQRIMEDGEDAGHGWWTLYRSYVELERVKKPRRAKVIP